MYFASQYFVQSYFAAGYFGAVQDTDSEVVLIQTVFRSVGSTNPVLFVFPLGSLTDADFEKTKRISGGSLADITGEITYLYQYIGEYWYQIAYDATDWPSGVGSAQYEITHGSNVIGVDLQVSGGINNNFANATIMDVPPVTASGRLRTLIIGDDYLAANGRALTWTVPAVAGFTVADVVARFGLTATLSCGVYSATVTGSVTDNLNGTWRVSIDLPGSATIALLSGDYDYSMTLQSNGVNITKIQNLTPTDRVKLFASPS